MLSLVPLKDICPNFPISGVCPRILAMPLILFGFVGVTLVGRTIITMAVKLKQSRSKIVMTIEGVF
jgi:hypothetical protein